MKKSILGFEKKHIPGNELFSACIGMQASIKSNELAKDAQETQEKHRSRFVWLDGDEPFIPNQTFSLDR
ncbi:hypothetical protein [Quatrionicoccus australiensis]|uniref:hypothetical protein n=1 Tax=Quatrionicoccus australiensis TaxID=138118 RepID=UPI001CFA7B1C|nr:hypothetical protein [Quatrionicoccus australiensis]MCB4358439.1 hypothetical protein [Quatrionicoccus australiensis]